MTGMPAFGASRSEEEVWQLVAALRRLPRLSPEERRMLEERSGSMERAAIEKDVSDEALMSDLASGHQDAIGLLYARYAPTILGMAAQALDRPTAEDIVQDVFLSVWKNAST